MKVLVLRMREVDIGLIKDIDHTDEIVIYGQDVDIYDEKLYKGIDAVMYCDSTQEVSEKYFEMLERNGIKAFGVKMTGYQQVDLDAARKHGVTVCNVRGYSPNAISELTLALALSLNRQIPEIGEDTHTHHFEIRYDMFKEIRDCTVGIIGTGKIGSTTAKMFRDLGSRVLGYDPFPNENNKQVLEYADLETLQKECDIVIVHSPYIKDQNYHLVSKEFISKLKPGCVLINTARGELVDLSAVIEKVKKNELLYGCDVLENEEDYFFKNEDHIKKNRIIEEAVSLYPKIVVTPHIGVNTIRARKTMIEMCLDQLRELVLTGSCFNMVN